MPIPEVEMTEADKIPDAQQGQNKTANEIVDYLLKHPNNKDTMKGIAEWWLEMHYIDQGVELVSKALTQLCSKGIVLKQTPGDRYPYYELKIQEDKVSGS